MKTGSIARMGAIAFLALGLGIAEYGVRHRRAVEADGAALNEKQAQLNVEIREARGKIETDNRELARLQALRKKPPAASATRARAAQSDAVLLNSHPKLLDLYLKSFRAGLSQRYGVFYRMAGLAPEQIAKFEDLAAKHQEAVMDLAAAATSQGVGNADRAIAALRTQQNDEFTSAQIALLGDAGYQQLLQFNRAEGALGLVNGAAEFALAPTDAYTYAQTEQLMQIVANASPPFQQGGAFDPTAVDWDSVEAQASQVLYPAQMAALKAQADAIILMTRLLPAYRRRPEGQ